LFANQFEKSSVERPFTEVLEQDSDVAVWLKNGDWGQEHFAIKYALRGEEALFYPDFLVKTASGGIRIYDTKGSGSSDISTGNTPDTYAKAEALAAYTADLRKRGLDIDGGIVVKKGWRWWWHPGEGYSGTTDVSEQKGWLAFSVASRTSE
jgi:type III restriction enzyme